MKNKLLWKPSQKRAENTSLFKFIEHLNTNYKEKIDNFEALHTWSVKNRNYFAYQRQIIFFVVSCYAKTIV